MQAYLNCTPMPVVGKGLLLFSDHLLSRYSAVFIKQKSSYLKKNKHFENSLCVCFISWIYADVN